MAANDPAPDRTSPDGADLEDILHRFEDAWQRGDRPDLSAYLPEEPARHWAALVELAHIDLEQRLKAGEPVRAEGYFQRFPELAGDAEEALMLVARELELRQRLEPGLLLDEYSRRFPQFSSQLFSALGSMDQTRADATPHDEDDLAPDDEAPSVSVTVASLVAALQTLPLLPADVRPELAELIDHFAEARELTDELVHQSVLTPFQARLALRGQAGRLVLGPYVLLDKLGEGGMGSVYRARPVDGAGFVALKVLSQERLKRRDALRRFRREVQAATSLNHPNIVRVFEARQTRDHHYLVMECIAGLDLQRLVGEAGPLPVARACDFVRQAALGLQHAHDMGMVHRDIKPSNLMVTPPAENPSPTPDDLLVPGAVLRILDMGLARLRGSAEMDESWSTLTRAGTIIGTPDYMAPEQWEDAHSSDIRADLYSLGCTLHFLLTGQVPFPGGTMIQKLDRHRTQIPVPVERLRPDVPPNLGPVVKKLLAKKPRERFQTPAELAEALERTLHGSRTISRAAIASRLQESPGEVRSFAGHQAAVTAVAGSPDSKQIITGGDDGSVRLWEAESGRELREFKGHTDAVKCVAYSPDGKLVLSAGADRDVRLWDTTTGRVVRSLVGHKGPVKTVAFSPDSRFAISGGEDRLIRLWDVASGRRLIRFEGHSGDVSCAVFSADGKHVLSSSWDKSVRLWDAKTGKELNCFGGMYSTWQWLVMLGVALAPDGRRFVAGGSDNVVRLCHIDDGRELANMTGHTDKVTSVAFSPDGMQLLSGSRDGTVRLWDGEAGRERHLFEGHRDAVASVTFTADGRHALSAAADRTVRMWRLPR